MNNKSDFVCYSLTSKKQLYFNSRISNDMAYSYYFQDEREVQLCVISNVINTGKGELRLYFFLPGCNYMCSNLYSQGKQGTETFRAGHVYGHSTLLIAG